MSKQQQIKISCDLCGHENSVEIWQSVNVSLNPELKQSVIDGRIFDIRCKQCNSKLELVYSLLYHDQTKKLMVWKVIPDKYGKIEFSKENVAFEKVLQREAYKLRIVLSNTSLAEKIKIFDDLLDDRIIELLKKGLWEEGRVDRNLPPDSIKYSGLITKNGTVDKVRIKQITPKGNEKGVYDISFEGGYLVMKNMVSRKFDFQEAEPTKWATVDHTYWNQLVGGQEKSQFELSQDSGNNMSAIFPPKLDLKTANRIFDVYFEMFVYYLTSLSLTTYAYKQKNFPSSLEFFQHARTAVNESRLHLNRMKNLWMAGTSICNDFNQMLYWHEEWIENFRKYRETWDTEFDTHHKGFIDVTKRQHNFERLRAQYREKADRVFGNALPHEFELGDYEARAIKRVKALLKNYKVPESHYMYVDF